MHGAELAGGSRQSGTALIQGERFRAVLLDPWRVNALSWLGNVSVGLLAAIAWHASPWGLALVAVPLGLLYLAYRGWIAQTVEFLRVPWTSRARISIASLNRCVRPIRCWDTAAAGWA